LHWRQNTFGHVRSLITIGHPPRDPTRSRDRRGRRFCAAGEISEGVGLPTNVPVSVQPPAVGTSNRGGSALQYAVAWGEPGVQDLLGPAWRRLAGHWRTLPCHHKGDLAAEAFLVRRGLRGPLGGAEMLSLETTGQDSGSVLFASSYRGETLAVTAVGVARTSENGVRSA